jgi:predicted amidohydrolase
MGYKIALCQFQPKLLNVNANLEKMEKMLTGLKADLVVFPELSTSGYVFNSQDEVRSVAEAYNSGPTAAKFKELARLNKCSYVIGFPEIENGEFYNSSMLVNPNGDVHLYRKIHLFNEEKRWFSDGNLGFNVFETKNRVKVGMMICFDWMFPESARTLMLKGAQIIAHPSNLVLPWCQKAMLTRSLENRVFSATCNRIGIEKNGEKEFYFTGKSQICSPLGEIITHADEDSEEIISAEIKISDADNKQVNQWNNLITDRKKKYYQV